MAAKKPNPFAKGKETGKEEKMEEKGKKKGGKKGFVPFQKKGKK